MEVNSVRLREKNAQRYFSERIQVFLVLLVHDDLTTVCSDLLLLVLFSGLSDKTLFLTIPNMQRKSVKLKLEECEIGGEEQIMSTIEFSPFHHVFVLVESVSLISHEVQDSRRSLLFKSCAPSAKT